MSLVFGLYSCALNSVKVTSFKSDQASGLTICVGQILYSILEKS